MLNQPTRPADADACVELAISKVGRRIVLGLPLGLGKSTTLADAFYRRAEADPSIELLVFTALDLAPPGWSSDLERRLVEPIAERLFGGCPVPLYAAAMMRGELPPNVEVHEFYFAPGTYLGSPTAQQGYVSSNYTHVVRDLDAFGVNVLAQIVAEGTYRGRPALSLSCNPDLTVDLVPRMRARAAAGEPTVVLGEVHPDLPFMHGAALVEPEFFDALIPTPAPVHSLFGPPNPSVALVDHAIAWNVSALIPDGGTLQLGIGSLGDAVSWMLKLRHERNVEWRALLEDAGTLERHGELIDEVGGRDTFEVGLYGASEMLVDGFLDLRRAGILKREVFDSLPLQRLADAGRLPEYASLELLALLASEGVTSAPWTEADVRLLEEIGALQHGARFDRGDVVLLDGTRVPADPLIPDVAVALGDRVIGEVLHSAFFLGPREFYRALRELPEEERRRITMTGVAFVNQLYGGEELRRLQRKKARFVNSGMIALATGAVVSDGLEDGRVVSGVGGQFDFVAQAHALEDARSILMVRSTFERPGHLSSNVRWSYGHTTIPRHLRDIVVTEYGIADLRGRTDRAVVEAMISVADARFQEGLVRDAVRAGKLTKGWRIPDAARRNTPDELARRVQTQSAAGLLPVFPFGTDLTEEEITLGRSLKKLAAKRGLSAFPGWRQLKATFAPPASAQPYLERMGLADASGLRERLLRRLVVLALAGDGAI